VHTLWYAIPVPSSEGDQGSGGDAQPKAGTIAITFIGYLLIVGFVAYTLSFASLLKMSTLQISGALALFAVAAQVSRYSAHGRSFLFSVNNAGFMLVCIIGSAYILHYWPW